MVFGFLIKNEKVLFPEKTLKSSSEKLEKLHVETFVSHSDESQYWNVFIRFQKVNVGCENTLKNWTENESESHNYNEHTANAAPSVHHLTQWRHFAQHEPSAFAKIRPATAATSPSRQRWWQQPKQGSQRLLQWPQSSWVSSLVLQWMNFFVLLSLRPVYILHWR